MPSFIFSVIFFAVKTANAPVLVGLEPKDVQQLFGEVSFKRWEGSAQVMQFTGGCILDIYFYEEAPGQAYRATYLTARTSEGLFMETDPCVRILLERRQPN